MSSSRPLTKEQVKEMFPDFFDEGLGLLEGEYDIRLTDSAKAVQHAPRRGQVALRNKIRETLEELHSLGVIETVSKPTPLISSMLAVPKKNWKNKNLSRSEGSQHSYSSRKISYTYHRGHCNSPSWCQSVFRPRCEEWVSACQIG